jgi:hypothetical protein
LSDLEARLEATRAIARTRGKKAVPEPLESPATVPVGTFPTWPEPVRGTPNAFLRGALFAAVQGKTRRAFKGELIACQPGVSIRLTGWQLGQSDLDVWETAIRMAAHTPLGEVCQFRVKTFLKAMGRATGGTDKEWLRASLRRLAAALIEIKQDHLTYAGTLIEKWKHDDRDDEYWLMLNPELLTLYQAGWTAIHWETRLELKGKPLALWLHGWIVSNATNYPTKLETIHSLCGSTNKQMAGFRRQVEAALADLQTVGFLTGFSIDGKLVSVTRVPSKSQARHLTKLL